MVAVWPAIKNVTLRFQLAGLLFWSAVIAEWFIESSLSEMGEKAQANVSAAHHIWQGIGCQLSINELELGEKR
jgi:hypothetical protein